jgi:Ulp1 family protease
MIDTTSIVMTKAPKRLKAKAPIQHSIPEQPQFEDCGILLA